MDDSEDIRISEEDASLAAPIEAALRDTLRQLLPQAENRSITLAARDGDDGLVGGLAAATSYGWIHISMLWVAEGVRSRGLGHSLMTRAEDRARALGCHAAWLETSNPAALGFYRSLGYRPFGELANQPGQTPSGHRRWFLQKDL